MKTLHSPAPWTVYEVTERTAFLSLAITEDTFMRIEFFDMPEEQMKPNLALIAAAPAMLAALCKAETLLSASYLDHAQTTNGKPIFEGLELVRAAIAEATAAQSG